MAAIFEAISAAISAALNTQNLTANGHMQC
jgi:hypothetical protein